MFTGIIEEVGKIKSVKTRGDNSLLNISAEIVTEGIMIGSSIAVNGVCLTAVEINKTDFTAEATKETLQRSNLQKLKPGSKVNLERPLRADGRLDGHIVMGHVDTVGKIKVIKKGEGSWFVAVEVPEKYVKYIADKGSIAVDGISLTVTECKGSAFTLNIIPHTFEITILDDKKPGDEVNIEVDITGKYIEKMLIEDKKEITEEFLNENGY